VLQAPYERLFGTAASGAEYVLSSRVDGWKTTASSSVIEIWSGAYSGVKSASGKAHAELNADQVSALYQARCAKARCSARYVASSARTSVGDNDVRRGLMKADTRAAQDIDTVPGMLLYWCATHVRVCLLLREPVARGPTYRLCVVVHFMTAGAGLCRIEGAPARTSWSCASARPRRLCCSAAWRTATPRGGATTGRTPFPPASL
jgi:hypothetical protein